MKPNWQDAPAWANYLAMDQTGEWWWYEGRPSFNGFVWMPSPGRMEIASAWRPLEARVSLEPRL